YGDVRLCAAIMGFADLTMGEQVAEVLDAQKAVSPRFRGVRVSATVDPGGEKPGFNTPTGLLGEREFRARFAQLHPRGLGFEAWVYHHQLADVTDLARAFPQTTIILNHIGGLLVAAPPYGGQDNDAVAAWKRSLCELADCSNVFVKLGGRGMPYLAYGFDK